MNTESCRVRVLVNEGSNRGVLVLLVPPECTVQDLKALIFKNHKIPVEVQAWFRDDKQSLGLLKDDSAIKMDESLWLYLRPMALCRENVRRSDFDRWHEEITNAEALPDGVRVDSTMSSAHPKASPAVTAAVRPRQPPQTASPMATINQDVDIEPQEMTLTKRQKAKIVLEDCQLCGKPPNTYCYECNKTQSILCNSCSAVVHSDEYTQWHNVVSATKGTQQPKIAEVVHLKHRRDVNIVSDYCHVCGEAPAVFCFTCDEKQSFYCEHCSNVMHSDESTQAHDVVSVTEVTRLAEPDALRFVDDRSQRNELNRKAPRGWECTACTYLNLPLRPGCLQCTTERPAAYKVPEGYVPTAEEQKILEVQQRAEETLELASADEDSDNNETN